MDVRALVRHHYGTVDVTEAVLATLRDAGTDVDHLSADDLQPVDQLHAGGAPATVHLVQRLDLAPGAPDSWTSGAASAVLPGSRRGRGRRCPAST